MNRLEMTQLNIRIDIEVADIFRKFCAESGLTQNECMRWLLEQAVNDSVNKPKPWAEELLICKEEKRKLREEVAEFRRKQGEAVRKERQKRHTLLKIYNQATRIIAERRERLDLPTLIPFTRRQWDRKTFRSYKYPQESGAITVDIQHLAYGRGWQYGPLFVLGKTEQQELLKFRYYSKNEYVGISPKTAMHNEEWLFGYAVSPDGAADLLFGLPLSSVLDAENPNDTLGYILSELPPQILATESLPATVQNHSLAKTEIDIPLPPSHIAETSPPTPPYISLEQQIQNANRRRK